jgi:4-hydroxy-tetrahydrodipicolinate reductase
MKILLVGYGKMGKTIERIAVARGHEIVGRVDVGTTDAIRAGADVAIEFTQPGSAPENIKKCIAAGVPVVCGTTGWSDQLEEIKSVVAKNDGTLFYTSNFSLGVNIFFKVNEYLAKLMRGRNDYGVKIDETHHTEKKDAPSGTAITLAEGVIRGNSTKNKWVTNTPASDNEVPIRSHRIDPAPGTHVVSYRSTVDDIEIKHTAHSREGFAYGAVLVAEWIQGKKGILTMDNFLTF